MATSLAALSQNKAATKLPGKAPPTFIPVYKLFSVIKPPKLNALGQSEREDRERDRERDREQRGGEGGSVAHFLASKLISADALHEADGVWVELVGLAGQTGHSEGNPEPHPAKVAHLKQG